MRVALFTSQFPGKVSTFFARDVTALVAAGVQVDIFPIYPVNAALWQFVPATMADIVDLRSITRSISGVSRLTAWSRLSRPRMGQVARGMKAVVRSAAHFGLAPVLKSLYAGATGISLAVNNAIEYDHVLSYWGNYAATCAYVFHLLAAPRSSFSFLLHAGTDLYRNQVFLPDKLLYADRVILVCRFNRDFLHALYPHLFPGLERKLYYHHLGLDCENLHYRATGRAPNRVIGVGSFHRQKGFDVLVRAVASLRSGGADVELELVGDGPERGSLERLASSLDITEHVAFRGWLPPAQTIEAIRGAALLVHPSTEIGDAVPTVIKEAMAVGTSVIGSAVAGIPELLNNGACGTLVVPGSVSALAEAIARLLAAPMLRRRIAERGRLFAEDNFDMWRNGARLAGLLKTTRRNCPARGSQDELLP